MDLLMKMINDKTSRKNSSLKHGIRSKLTPRRRQHHFVTWCIADRQLKVLVNRQGSNMDARKIYYAREHRIVTSFPVRS